jgi:hypothetical protein
MTVMSSTRQRIKELYDKMSRGGITRDERVELTALEARVEVAKLQKIEADKVKAEGEAEREQIRQERAQIAAQVAELDREAALLEIFRKEYAGKLLVDNEANRAQVLTLYENDLYNDDPLGAAWFASRLNDDSKLASRFAWTARPDPNARKLQEEVDRNTFEQLCNTDGVDISGSEANFRLLRDTLGSGFNLYAAKQAVQSNAVLLSPATPAEINAREAVRIDQHNFKLLTSDVHTLKQLTREEAERRRVEAAQANADRDLAIRTEIQGQQGFEPLPDTYKGQAVNRAFFLKCSREVMKYFLQRYGSAQIDQRIRSAA